MRGGNISKTQQTYRISYVPVQCEGEQNSQIGQHEITESAGHHGPATQKDQQLSSGSENARHGLASHHQVHAFDGEQRDETSENGLQIRGNKVERKHQNQCDQQELGLNCPTESIIINKSLISLFETYFGPY